MLENIRELNFAKTIKRYKFDFFVSDKHYEIVFQMLNNDLKVSITSISKYTDLQWAPIIKTIKNQLTLLFDEFMYSLDSSLKPLTPTAITITPPERSPEKSPERSPKSPKSPKSAKEKSPAQCITVRGIQLCGTKTPRYFEEQSLKLCLLHSINNLIQNKVLNAKLFTKKDFDSECEKIHKQFNYIDCEEDGNYVIEVAMRSLDSLGLGHEFYDLSKRSDKEYLKLVTRLLTDVQNNTCVMGIIMTYVDYANEYGSKDDSEGLNHAVTVYYDVDKYVIIASESTKGAYLVKSSADVIKYFKEENFVDALKVYHRVLDDFNDLRPGR